MKSNLGRLYYKKIDRATRVVEGSREIGIAMGRESSFGVSVKEVLKYLIVGRSVGKVKEEGSNWSCV